MKFLSYFLLSFISMSTFAGTIECKIFQDKGDVQKGYEEVDSVKLDSSKFFARKLIQGTNELYIYLDVPATDTTKLNVLVNRGKRLFGEELLYLHGNPETSFSGRNQSENLWVFCNITK